MTIRSTRERVFQTLAFEAGGLIVAAPLYGRVFGETQGQTFYLLMILSVIVMLWSLLHNTAFDWIDFELNGRLASDRPHGLRMAQALSLELSAVMLTMPVIMKVGGHSVFEALTVDVGLTLVYVTYGYCFHLVFDRLRPVVTETGLTERRLLNR